MVLVKDMNVTKTIMYVMSAAMLCMIAAGCCPDGSKNLPEIHASDFR